VYYGGASRQAIWCIVGTRSVKTSTLDVPPGHMVHCRYSVCQDQHPGWPGGGHCSSGATRCWLPSVLGVAAYETRPGNRSLPLAGGCVERHSRMRLSLAAMYCHMAIVAITVPPMVLEYHWLVGTKWYSVPVVRTIGTYVRTY
jgi:hypothetical protein